MGSRRTAHRSCIILSRFSMLCLLKLSPADSITEVIERQSSFLHFGHAMSEQSKPESTLNVSENPQAAHPTVMMSFINYLSFSRTSVRNLIIILALKKIQAGIFYSRPVPNECSLLSKN